MFANPRENGAGIIIEDDVLIGSGVHFYVANHRHDNLSIPVIDQGHEDSQEIVLKKGCWVGANTILLPGVIIGANSVIGTGSVVTKNIPESVIAIGNPARIVRDAKFDKR